MESIGKQYIKINSDLKAFTILTDDYASGVAIIEDSPTDVSFSHNMPGVKFPLKKGESFEHKSVWTIDK